MDVEGDIAEFGTMSGMTAQVLANAVHMSDANWGYAVKAAGFPPKVLHLFDSFVGIPQSTEAPDMESPHVQSGVWSPGACRGLSATQLEQLCTAILPKERIRIHEGWYADTVPRLPEGTKFGCLHIDCDLYISTMDVLVPLFQRRMISSGAILFFDDWNCNRASPDYGERKAWAECVERFGVRYSDEGSYGVVSHKFIVHAYE
jgi:hypothetical protein